MHDDRHMQVAWLAIIRIGNVNCSYFCEGSIKSWYGQSHCMHVVAHAFLRGVKFLCLEEGQGLYRRYSTVHFLVCCLLWLHCVFMKYVQWIHHTHTSLYNYNYNQCVYAVYALG